VGLTGAGKTTLFNALTGADLPVATFEGPSGETHLHHVPIPDARLDFLGELCQPRKLTPAVIEFLDIPGLPLGPKEPKEGRRRLLGLLHDTDGLMLVLPSFASARAPHPFGNIDPPRDLAELEAELQLADLETIEHRIGRLKATLKKPVPTREQDKAELALLGRCKEWLEADRPLAQLEPTREERKLLGSFQFLTLKSQILVFNIDESQISAAHDASLSYFKHDWPSLPIPICAELQMEILQLDETDRQAFREDMGISEEVVEALLQESYRRLGYISFFTTVGEEVRAWLLPEGGSALDASGRIHTDIARGFIRAELIAFDDLKSAGSLEEVKHQGKMQLVGKEHIILDGDVVYFRFSA